MRPELDKRKPDGYFRNAIDVFRKAQRKYLCVMSEKEVFQVKSFSKLFLNLVNFSVFSIFPRNFFRQFFRHFSRGAIPAKIYECFHPDLPEVVNDSDELFKCKPKGFTLAQKKTKELLAKESHFTPKKEVLAGKGLPVVFRDERPVCPTSKVMRQRFEFDHTTRFPDNR